MTIKFVDIVDVAVVGYFAYWTISMFRHTRSMQILKGVLVIFAFKSLSEYAGFRLVNELLGYLMTMTLVSVPVIFSREFRVAFSRLGNFDFGAINKRELSYIDEVVAAVEEFSKRKTGALVVFEHKTSLGEYSETGVSIGGRVSRELLGVIFRKNSELHDGAVIVRGEKIEVAGAILPLSQWVNGSRHGTRHRAAIGVSELTDASALVVSEETGEVSLSVDGKIEVMGIEGLKERLQDLVSERDYAGVNWASMRSGLTWGSKISLWVAMLIASIKGQEVSSNRQEESLEEGEDRS